MMRKAFSAMTLEDSEGSSPKSPVRIGYGKRLQSPSQQCASSSTLSSSLAASNYPPCSLHYRTSHPKCQSCLLSSKGKDTLPILNVSGNNKAEHDRENTTFQRKRKRKPFLAKCKAVAVVDTGMDADVDEPSYLSSKITPEIEVEESDTDEQRLLKDEKRQVMVVAKDSQELATLSSMEFCQDPPPPQSPQLPQSPQSSESASHLPAQNESTPVVAKSFALHPCLKLRRVPKEDQDHHHPSDVAESNDNARQNHKSVSFLEEPPRIFVIPRSGKGRSLREYHMAEQAAVKAFRNKQLSTSWTDSSDESESLDVAKPKQLRIKVGNLYFLVDEPAVNGNTSSDPKTSADPATMTAVKSRPLSGNLSCKKLTKRRKRHR